MTRSSRRRSRSARLGRGAEAGAAVSRWKRAPCRALNSARRSPARTSGWSPRPGTGWRAAPRSPETDGGPRRPPFANTRPVRTSQAPMSVVVPWRRHSNLSRPARPGAAWRPETRRSRAWIPVLASTQTTCAPSGGDEVHAADLRAISRNAGAGCGATGACGGDGGRRCARGTAHFAFAQPNLRRRGEHPRQRRAGPDVANGRLRTVRSLARELHVLDAIFDPHARGSARALAVNERLHAAVRREPPAPLAHRPVRTADLARDIRVRQPPPRKQHDLLASRVTPCRLRRPRRLLALASRRW